MSNKFTKLFVGDVVKTVGSKVFRKLTTEQPIVEDELQGTWVFNDTLTLDTTVNYSVNFTSNSVSYTLLTVWHADTVMPIPKGLYFTNSDVEFEVYYSGWHEQIYKTINITSKLSEVENGETLLTFLKANATKKSATTPTLITFTIDGTTYQAEEGMTWEQWVNSDYNTAPICYISGTSVLYSNDPSGTTIGTITGATSTSQIASGASYSTNHGGGTN